MSSTPISLTPDVVDAATRLLSSQERLCSECMGRFFGKLGHGLSNSDRLEGLGRSLSIRPSPVMDHSLCAICHGAFATIPAWVDRALSTVSGYEWATFRCGSRWEPSYLATEENLWATYGTSWGESLRTAFNREFGKALARTTGKNGGESLEDILFIADIPIGRVEQTVASAYFKGRYRKYDRTIPQTRWPCRVCKGRGCQKCDGTGKMYETSVEELIAGPLISMTEGTGHRLHGMGREDIDARMLGRGRPFVVEIISPRKRNVSMAEAMREVNTLSSGRAEVVGLAPCTLNEVKKVKEEVHDKSYRIVLGGEVGQEKIIEAVNLLKSCELAQRTPVRVSHRRADLVRHRKIREMKMVGSAEGTFTLELRAEAGTYIKEFVTGDGGRTIPNLSDAVGSPLRVISLDVLEIHDGDEQVAW